MGIEIQLEQIASTSSATKAKAWDQLRELLVRADSPKSTDSKKLAEVMDTLQLTAEQVIEMRAAVCEAIDAAKVAATLPGWIESEQRATADFAAFCKKIDDEIRELQHQVAKARVPLTGTREQRQLAERARRRLEELSSLHPQLVGQYFTPACFVTDPAELAARQQREALEAHIREGLAGCLIEPCPDHIIDRVAADLPLTRGDFDPNDANPDAEILHPPICKLDSITRRIDARRRDLAYLLNSGEIDAGDVGPAVHQLAAHRHGWTDRRARKQSEPRFAAGSFAGGAIHFPGAGR